MTNLEAKLYSLGATIGIRQYFAALERGSIVVSPQLLGVVIRWSPFDVQKGRYELFQDSLCEDFAAQ